MLLSSEYRLIVWECREKIQNGECQESHCHTRCETLPTAHILRYYQAPSPLTIDSMLHPSLYRHDSNPLVIHGMAERFPTPFWEAIALSAHKKQSAYFHLQNEAWIDSITWDQFSLLASFSRENPDIFRVGFSENGELMSVEDIITGVKKLVQTNTFQYPRWVKNLPEEVMKKVEDMTSTLGRILWQM